MSSNLSPLKKILLADQADRDNEELKKLDPSERWKIIGKRDIKRKEQVEKILATQDNLSGEEYYCAAMIFQHTASLDDLIRAKELAKTAVEHGYERGKWLSAAATDRYLIQKGEGQKYGTQFYWDEKTQDWEPFPIGEEASEKEKLALDVKPVQETKNVLKNRTRESESGDF